MKNQSTFEISGNIVDLINERIFPGLVTITDGKISSIAEMKNVDDQFILPGLIDAHIHIESSMLIPSEFARLAVVHGTVATVSDPHEIANVLGIDGIRYMINNGKKVPFHFYFGASSCVPATVFETSGASLGVAFIILGFSEQLLPGNIQGLGNWALVAASWLGAGAVMMIIMYISVRVRDIMTVLILGIMLSSGISAIVSIMQYFSNETMLKAYVIWTMGSLGNLTSQQLEVLAISVTIGVILILFSVKMLNALLLGENYAISIGLNVRFARIVIFAGTSILAGSVTAFCGPIGFIGIAVPHIARIIFRTSDHKVLIPATIFLGGSVMLLSDIISQLPGSDSVLPINSVTSLVGIPVVIWVILRNRKFSGTF